MNDVISSATELSAFIAERRGARRRVGLVPTMGALHAGHLSLVARAQEQCDDVVASIFVNPLQFNESEDFARYPRDLESDLALLSGVGVSLVFAPSAAEMFPAGEPEVTVDPGALGEILEGASRPGHFRGVATIVAELFAVCGADAAYFGEKDYQQLTIIHRLVLDLGFPIDIVACPTMRDPDGCAISSRNRRLSGKERAAANVLYRALVAGSERCQSGERARQAIEDEMAAIVGAEPLATLDYAVVRDAERLTARDPLAGSLRLLVAARIGPVRLIDNIGVVA